MNEMKNNTAAPNGEEGAAFLYISDEEEFSSSVELEDKLSDSLRADRGRNPLAAFWRNLCLNMPHRGDRGGTLVRKLVFWLALVALVCSAGYIVYDLAVQPVVNNAVYTQVAEQYEPENSELSEKSDYPVGMLASFEDLYDRNSDVRGWLTFSADGEDDFLRIHYPVMHSGDNVKYLTRDFQGNKSKSGALFFDMRNVIEPLNNENKVLIIYGHNMASGQMFAGLNKLIGKTGNARAATAFTLSTLFERNEYKVFAAVITDEDATGAEYFSTLRTQFDSDEDFLDYVEQVRARSLYDYPVDVLAEDELVVLSTCTAKSTAKVKNGRLVVFARRVRYGEDTAVDAAAITVNEDVIMPMAWYENQKLPLHEYYTADVPVEDEVPSVDTTPTQIPSDDVDQNDTTQSDDTENESADGDTTSSGAVQSTTAQSANENDATQSVPTQSDPADSLVTQTETDDSATMQSDVVSTTESTTTKKDASPSTTAPADEEFIIDEELTVDFGDLF